MANKERRSEGFFSRMTDEELIAYTERNHKGKTSSQVSDDEQRLYKHLCARNLIVEAIKKNILTRKNRQGLLKIMSDEELFIYVEKNYGRMNLTEFHKAEGGLYHELKERRMLKKLTDEKILLRKSQKFTGQGNEQLIETIRKKYQGKSLMEFIDSSQGLYDLALKRRLINRLVEEGVLKREIVKKNSWKSIKYSFEQAEKFMHEHPEFEYLPQSEILRTYGYSSLTWSISKYHGGFPAFREKLRKYMGQSSEKSELESLIREYISGGEK